MKGGDQVQDEEDDTETGRAAPPQSSLVVGLSEKSGLVHRSVRNASFASESASITDTWHDNRSSIPLPQLLTIKVAATILLLQECDAGGNPSSTISTWIRLSFLDQRIHSSIQSQSIPSPSLSASASLLCPSYAYF
jgi:hypothetical protein